MRLREVEAAEKQYLIFNGWFSYKITVASKEPLFAHPEHCPKGTLLLTLDDAVKFQKAIDRSLISDPTPTVPPPAVGP